MTTTEHFGSTAARTRSQVSKCISIKEATGKPRNVATGRAARTYFDHGIDCKSALMRLIHQSPLVDNYRKGLLVPYFGRLLSLQRFSVLRDLQDGHCCLIQRESRAFPPDSHIPFWFLVSLPRVLASTPSLPSHIWEDWKWKVSCCRDLTWVRLSIKRGKKWNRQCFQIYSRSSFFF